jgi:hypothetical protein
LLALAGSVVVADGGCSACGPDGGVEQVAVCLRDAAATPARLALAFFAHDGIAFKSVTLLKIENRGFSSRLPRIVRVRGSPKGNGMEEEERRRKRLARVTKKSILEFKKNAPC